MGCFKYVIRATTKYININHHFNLVMRNIQLNGLSVNLTNRWYCNITKPQRPLTPYLVFSSQVRPTLNKQNHEKSMVYISKLISELWHNLSPELKKKLYDKYELEMEKYRLFKKSYEQSLTTEQIEELKKERMKKKAARDKRALKMENERLGRPQRPKTPYGLYCESCERAAEYLATDIGDPKEYKKKTKFRWKNLPENKRQFWKQRANELNDEYKKALYTWEETMIELGNFELVRKKSLSTYYLKKNEALENSVKKPHNDNDEPSSIDLNDYKINNDDDTSLNKLKMGSQNSI